MERKEGRSGRLAVLLPPAFLGLSLIVAAVVFASVQEAFADYDCYCAPCYINLGQTRITAAWKDGEEGDCDDALQCRVVRHECRDGSCSSLGESCWYYPSGPCSNLLCSPG